MTVLIDSYSWIEYFRGSASGRTYKEYIDSDEDFKSADGVELIR